MNELALAILGPMPLPNDYAGQACSVARSLEIVGERWTMLIVRDAFYGVRRFGDFVTHLEIPRAVLAARLKALVAEGVLVREPGPGGHDEYAMTEKGTRLWPVIRELMAWGDHYYAPRGPRRVLTHAADGGLLDAESRCEACGADVPVRDTVVAPGPGFDLAERRDDPVTEAMGRPRRLLDPLRV
jgi:DNA-binding HxlR family transcriptional regulator